MTLHILTSLKKAGFSEKAATVYMYLLEHGGAYPSTIAESTHLNRSTVYKLLTELAIKGLVQEVQKGKKLFYQAYTPSHFQRFAHERHQIAQTMFAESEKLFPKLQELFGDMPNKPKLYYFEGLKGVLSVYEDHVSAKEPYEMVAFGHSGAIDHFLPHAFYVKYRKEKVRIGITTRGVLAGDVSGTSIDELYRNVPKRYKLDLRFIPKDRFPFPGEITVYGTNKVSIVNLNENHLTGLIIEDASFNQAMRTIFELAWAGARDSLL